MVDDPNFWTLRFWIFSLICEHLPFCVGEVFVQGDEGPVGGVAQGVHCHGVTVGHEEKEEEEIEQEVEGEKEEKRSNNNAHVHGWDDYEDKCERLEP